MSQTDEARLAKIRELLPQLKEERTSVFCKAVTHREKIWLAEEAIKYLLSRVAAPIEDKGDGERMLDEREGL